MPPSSPRLISTVLGLALAVVIPAHAANPDAGAAAPPADAAATVATPPPDQPPHVPRLNSGSVTKSPSGAGLPQPKSGPVTQSPSGAAGRGCHGDPHEAGSAGPVRARETLRPGVLADYDAELRMPGGRVDVDRMVARLKQLGVNSYFWLIWHAPTDWQDLQRFLPAAQQAGIRVWVYLVPPTESPPNTDRYAEPFRLDYLRWAEEIARLSNQQPNLVGWVIDDFDANRRLFTPQYVADLQQRAHAINPRLLFAPLMYFNEVRPDWVREYHDVVDGVVVAYPQDREQIENARAILNGQPGGGDFSFPGMTHSRPGDFAAVSQEARVTDPAHAVIRFRERDSFTGPTAGYHFKQVLIDDTVVWEEDAAGGTTGWQDVSVDVSPQVASKRQVRITFRLLDRKGVSNFSLVWRPADLKLEGLRMRSGLDHPRAWKVQARGAFSTGFGATARRSLPGVRIPFLVMTAAELSEFRMRHSDPATPERMAQWLRMCLDEYHKGQCDGVVTYVLDKSPASATFDLAAQAFHTGVE